MAAWGGQAGATSWITSWEAVGSDGSVFCRPVQPLPTYVRKTLDGKFNTGRFSAVVIGVDGMPLITYYDDTNHWLMVALEGTVLLARITRKSAHALNLQPGMEVVAQVKSVAVA